MGILLNRASVFTVMIALCLSCNAAISQTGGEAKTDNTVEMTNQLKFVPNELRIQAGETVTWRNTSSLVHTATADPSLAADKSHVHLPPKAEPFNSGYVQPGNSYQQRFDVPGRYKYFCIPHERSGMVGEIIVE